MEKLKIVIVAALTLPLLVSTAYAATAHNLQTGAHTKNAYDTAETAYMKQVQSHHEDPVAERSLFGYSHP